MIKGFESIFTFNFLIERLVVSILWILSLEQEVKKKVNKKENIEKERESRNQSEKRETRIKKRKAKNEKWEMRNEKRLNKSGKVRLLVMHLYWFWKKYIV